MMEWLNNANVIAGLIVAIFGIGGYIFAIATYLKGKVTKSLQADKSPSHTPSVRHVNTDNIAFERIDWVNAFAKGFFYFSTGAVNDSDHADPLPMGCFFTPVAAAFGCAMFAIIFYFIFNILFNWKTDDAVRGAFVVGLICLGTVLLGIYIHYVGKAVETITKKKREPVEQPTTYNRPTQYRRK
jgi:hypothetical protein